VGNNSPDFPDRRTEPGEITGWFQTVNRPTARTAEATEIDGIRPAGKIGEHKAVPPQAGLTMGARTRLGPGKKTSQTCNILDVDTNRKYQ